MQPLVGRGYRFYLDNWYTSTPLAKYLQANQTGMCGTIRKNRLGLPKRLTTFKLSKKGEFVTCSSGGVVAWCDVQQWWRGGCQAQKHQGGNVFEYTSLYCHSVQAGKRDRDGNRAGKLKLVQDYNNHMGGVDRNDTMISYYTATRKTYKWDKNGRAYHRRRHSQRSPFVQVPGPEKEPL
eukprot:scpid75620/ scgid28227/ PiggyBac transposable element-derived protein 4